MVVSYPWDMNELLNVSNICLNKHVKNQCRVAHRLSRLPKDACQVAFGNLKGVRLFFQACQAPTQIPAV